MGPLAGTEQRPLGELFSELAQESATLVRHEVELAKVEVKAKAKEAGADALRVAGGAVVGLIGAFALVAAAILALGTVIELWASALIVGALVSALGGVLVVLGLRAFERLDPAPQQTIRTLQENKQWLREQVSR